MLIIENQYLFVTLTRNDFASLDFFIETWGKNYNYPNMQLYNDILFKNELSNEDLKNLFQWKNGMPLSCKKEKSFQEKILVKLFIINQLKTQWDEKIFNQEFDSLSAVWKIFLSHIIHPEQYPIFDQHVYRAYKYIVDQVNESELPFYNKTKLKIYYKDYLPFYLNCKEIMDKRFTSKDLDDALWIFGKFLNEYPKLLL